MDYVAEKLWVAVDMLDGSDARKALTDAARGALSRLGPNDFPDADDRAMFESIMGRLTAFQALDGEGDIAASAQLLTPEQAQTLARDIRALQRRHPLE